VFPQRGRQNALRCIRIITDHGEVARRWKVEGRLAGRRCAEGQDRRCLPVGSRADEDRIQDRGRGWCIVHLRADP